LKLININVNKIATEDFYNAMKKLETRFIGVLHLWILF